jgi:cysteine desulfurase
MNNNNQISRRIYLDHAAATPVHPEVKEVMIPFLIETYGNPSAIHQEGVVARQAVEDSRQSVATTLGIKPNEVIFTSGGTESNNLALLGFVKHLHSESGRAYSDMEVVTTKIEHPSITEVLPVLKELGVTVRFVEVDEEGLITVPALKEVLSPKTVLVTFAYANSEIGVVQPVSRLARTIRKHEQENDCSVTMHVDAAQAPLWLPCALEQIGVDMMTLDVGKCNGPKGVGVLAVRHPENLSPILFGGGQEQGLRPGTENVAGIVGAAKALELAHELYKERAEKVSKVRDEAMIMLKEALPQIIFNGPVGDKSNERLANNINLSLPNFDTEYAVVYLDAHGIAASTKSACAGAGGGESVVVKTVTGDATRASSTIRVSLGEETTLEDMKYVVEVLVRFCERMKG